jgi:carbamoyl-phosphate synthase large subunit
MGVHTGDSITVAPAMTLTDKEYQRMRDAAIAIVREIGVVAGGSNVQFAVDPATGRMLAIEMNPRVSRSSALASKATGFPIAKLAARLAIGYTLDELRNDITRVTPASFEPSIDYVVVKWPRFAFEKFPGASRRLGPQMKSVGEAMAIGRTFREALGKVIRSLETGRAGFDLARGAGDDLRALEQAIAEPGPERLLQLGRAFQLGLTVDRAHALSGIDRWFLHHVCELARGELALAGRALGALAAGGDVSLPVGDRLGAHGLDVVRDELRSWKRLGMSDRRIATLVGASEDDVRAARLAAGVAPVFKRVDTCAAEFEAHTPYLYSTYDDECEARPTTRRKVMILGGGPNRIGQGIEFDYCCVHAAMALAEEGIESIMVNSNPETVSTDYDTSDRLYFEPVTLEDVLAIYALERPDGVLVQLGGQTPLNLARPLTRAGVRLLGTSADAIHRAEDRARFGEVTRALGLRVPRWGAAHSLAEARAILRDLGFPVMVRPSYVLGGRAMERVDDDAGLAAYFARMTSSAGLPLLIDEFLVDAIEVDVDAIADATGAVVIGGVMEHVEPAGIHSGDSACALPPYTLEPATVEEIERAVRALAVALDVVGLCNVQLAVHRGAVYVLEVNPRASRTVPFVSKATGVPLAKIAAKVMVGRTLAELGVSEVRPRHTSVKAVVLPFLKFGGTDPRLGPEMRSTGEVMGIDGGFASAFAKAWTATGARLPSPGPVVVLGDDAGPRAAEVAARYAALGFARVELGPADAAAAIARGEIALVIDLGDGAAPAAAGGREIRLAALRHGVPRASTARAALALADAIAAARTAPSPRALQAWLAAR